MYLLYCHVCNVWLNNYGEVKPKDPQQECLIHCPDCHRIWDGNAQCQCFKC